MSFLDRILPTDLPKGYRTSGHALEAHGSGRSCNVTISLSWCSVAMTYIFEVIQGIQFWTEAAVYAEKLLVHDGSQRQGAERIHTSFVNFLRVFVLTFELEGEIVCQMPALMISSQEPQGVGIPNLEGPEVEHTLDYASATSDTTRDNARLTSMLK